MGSRSMIGATTKEESEDGDAAREHGTSRRGALAVAISTLMLPPCLLCRYREIENSKCYLLVARDGSRIYGGQEIKNLSSQEWMMQ